MIDFLVTKKVVKIGKHLITIKRGSVVAYHALLVIILSENFNELDNIMKHFVDRWRKWRKRVDVRTIIDEILTFNTIKIKRTEAGAVDLEELKDNVQESLVYDITQLAHYLHWSLDDILSLSNPKIEYLLFSIKNLRAQDYIDNANATAMSSDHVDEILGKKKVKL